MTGVGEVLINQIAAMAGVETAEGGIDGDRKLMIADACQCPEEGDRQ